MAHLKLSTRILLAGVGVAVLLPIPMLVWILPEQRATGYRMKTESTQHLVQAAWGVLDYYGNQAASGAMPLAQAQAAAKETLRKARYQDGNYLWINLFATAC